MIWSTAKRYDCVRGKEIREDGYNVIQAAKEAVYLVPIFGRVIFTVYNFNDKRDRRQVGGDSNTVENE